MSKELILFIKILRRKFKMHFVRHIKNAQQQSESERMRSEKNFDNTHI
jgi:hypothetical protein